MKQKTAIIIGAGPAGLTAAYEFLDKTDIKPIVFEMSGDLGGISKTVNYKGNRIDIGGHRFFSKSKRVNQWWQNILPLQGSPASDDKILGREIELTDRSSYRPLGKQEPVELGPQDPDKTDNVFLYRHRFSRIYFLRKFFKYPITLSIETIRNLGLVRVFKVGISYIKVRLFPIKDERHLEDFFINRFGRRLYQTFFKSYTEKVWGVPCTKINPAWGAQRIKKLSISKAVTHAVKKMIRPDNSIRQEKTETSLIERFLYPKFGPGQMWEETAKRIEANGGEIRMHFKVIGIKLDGDSIQSITVENTKTKEKETITGDYFFSTMPIKELVKGMNEQAPDEIHRVAKGLMYRDFMTAGVLVNKLKVKNTTDIENVNDLIPENWIYIQEPDVKLCRLQIFNNWSPYMVQDPDTVWLGLEYMCQEEDDIWQMPEKDFAQLAINELVKIDLINKEDVLDNVVIKMPKAYPAYFGTYDEMDKIRSFMNNIENLYLIGRNGMHRYNNQDHSMLTAMTAVENIINGVKDKENIWSINLEKDYHEEETTDNNKITTKEEKLAQA